MKKNKKVKLPKLTTHIQSDNFTKNTFKGQTSSQGATMSFVTLIG